MWGKGQSGKKRCPVKIHSLQSLFDQCFIFFWLTWDSFLTHLSELVTEVIASDTSAVSFQRNCWSSVITVFGSVQHDLSGSLFVFWYGAVQTALCYLNLLGFVFFFLLLLPLKAKIIFSLTVQTEIRFLEQLPWISASQDKTPEPSFLLMNICVFCLSMVIILNLNMIRSEQVISDLVVSLTCDFKGQECRLFKIWQIELRYI